MIISMAVYSYIGPDRCDALLASARLEATDLGIFVAQDWDGSTFIRDKYHAVCQKHGADHVPLDVHSHMAGANMAAVQATDTPWVLVCSDDVLLPRGFIKKLTKFLHKNFDETQDIDGVHRYPRGRVAESFEFCQHVAGMYLHCWDRNEIEAMGRRGNDPYVPELSGFSDKMFYGLPPEHPDWWWRRIGYQLPEPRWSERTPSDRVACCSNVHGSAYVVNRRYWDMVGGTAGCDTWQNDSLLSLRLGLLTDGVIIRLPGLPSLAHRGGAAPSPPDPDKRWVASVHNLINEFGGSFDPDIAAELASDKPQAAFVRYETALKLRAAAYQTRYAAEIAALDMNYMELK